MMNWQYWKGQVKTTPSNQEVPLLINELNRLCASPAEFVGELRFR